MEEKIESLKPQIKKNGFVYVQVARSTRAAIYSAKNEACHEDTSIHFEVFTIKHSKPFTLIGKSGQTKGKEYFYPASERFPSNEDFGKWAWCFVNQETAMRMFEEIK